MKKLNIAICLALVTLLGSTSWNAYAQKNQTTLNDVQKLLPLAEQGDANAQFRLGLMYRDGQSVLQDYKTALTWFKLAAAQEHADAQLILGLIYRDGEIVPQDYKSALKWFKRAAAQGHAFAQWMISSMYINEEGLPRDFIYAHMWLNIAASSGDQDVSKKASEFRDNTAKFMSPADISKAQKLARECVAKKYVGCD